MKRTPSGQQQPPNERARPPPAPGRPSLSSRPQISSRNNVTSRMSQVSLASPSPTISPPATQDVPKQKRQDDSQGPLSPSTGNVNAPSALDLDMLREAVNKIQGKGYSRTVGAHSNPQSPASPRSSMRRSILSSNGAPDANTTQAMSPSLDAAFSSPLPTGIQTASTESTESARTVRASALPTPSGYPIRTPSYPFPYVPSMHQPFTILSPTSGPNPGSTDRYSSTSAHTTPLGAPSFFGPASTAVPQSESSTTLPNLYEVVLQLNAEPTLVAWWSSLTTILREQYRVDRASISIPADTTDIENVPWGQKASYNVAGLKEVAIAPPTSRSARNMEERTRVNENVQTSSTLNTMRPPMETRHSFAGHEAPRAIPEMGEVRFPSPSARPNLSRRQTSHISASRTPSWSDSPNVPASPAFTLPSDASGSLINSDEAEDDNDTAIILPMLRALDRERDPLLDSSGVNRIIQRSRIVVLTRDFATTPAIETRKGADESKAAEDASMNSTASSYNSLRSVPSQSGLKGRFFQGTDYHTATGKLEKTANYEEYEQFPSSPWAQSPAPSPAIQHDPEQNPFFEHGALDEESFNPTPVNEPYADFGQVEAIGVDKASTVLHIPLVHPLLSRTIRAATTPGVEANQSRRRRRSKQAAEAEYECKAPIAILSVLSPDVPYSQGLQKSLSQLAPHLATSFQTSYQNTILQDRVAGAIQRQQQSGRAAPGSLALPGNRLGLGLGLESLLQFESDDTLSSTVGSIASPSEYSSKSRNSPPGSLGGTPNLDPNATFRTGPITPGVAPAETNDNYFDLKKRKSLSRGKSSAAIPQSISSSQGSSRLTSEHRATLRKLETSPVSREPSNEARKDGKRYRARDESQRTSPADLASRIRPALQTSEEEKHHTYLHSHGADFNTSFQSLPAATALRTPGAGPHSRKPSAPEAYDMPPPSERLLRTIIDSLPVQIFTAAPLTGRVTWVNSKFLVYRGQTATEVLNDPWESVHPSDLTPYSEEWQRSLHTGQQFQHKLRLRRFDDHYRWYYVRAVPLRDKMQNIVHWVGTMIDLHDQHIAEVNASKQQETAASEAKYRALANSSPQIVFAATKTNGVTFCNTQWLSYSGQTEEQARGTGFMDYVYPDDLIKCKLPDFDESGEGASNVPITVPTPIKRTKSGSSDVTETGAHSPPSGIMSPDGMQMPQRKLSALASSGILRVSRDATGRPSYSTEVRLRMKSGEYRWHLVRVLLAEPLVSADREEDTWYGTCTDINDHKELEQTLKETMDAKSRFLSNMSHEIRTPLNGIHGMANFLIDSHLTSEQLDQVNVIRASTEGLRDLINDILDLSKVEAGMITLDYKWLHIRSIIEEVNDLTSSLALDKGVELNYLVHPNVPSMIKGDKFRFRQVLLNVIGNAIKFTQEGEVFIRCTLMDSSQSSTPNTAMLKFEVIDTGMGFNEKEAEKLFKRFSQIDASSTRQHGGTGLGLVISMQLVELHGGHMSASSVPGKGSTFTFTMQFGLPTDTDQPESMPKDNSVVQEKQMSVDNNWPSQEAAAPGTKGMSFQPDVSMSPSFYAGLEKKRRATPAMSSDSSANSSSTQASLTSSATAASTAPGSPIELQLPTDEKEKRHHEQDKERTLQQLSDQAPAKVGVAVTAKLYSILVVCSLAYTREATIGHLNSVLDHHVPHTVTAKATVEEAREVLIGSNPFRFSHVILSMTGIEDAEKLLEIVFKLSSSVPSVIIISNMAQRKDFKTRNGHLDFEQLRKERRLQFIPKPVKPSRLAIIFDPEKSRELSTDQNQTSAQQIALSQKKVFEEMTRRLGNKDIKVLLVEDNRINQMVMLKLLKRVSVAVETCFDGVQATDKVLGKPAGYFSIILLDLMMPNKDGYQTCRDIRAWEKKNNHPPIPIVALSANVLDDVWQKCGEAGFNSYLTKPVEFKELSDVMTQFLDPHDPKKPIAFMTKTRGG